MYIYSDISTNHIGQPVSVVDLSFIYVQYIHGDEEGTERRMEGRGQRTGTGKEGQKEK